MAERESARSLPARRWAPRRRGVSTRSTLANCREVPPPDGDWSLRCGASLAFPDVSSFPRSPPFGIVAMRVVVRILVVALFGAAVELAVIQAGVLRSAAGPARLPAGVAGLDGRPSAWIFVREGC